jgi:hypothetical protein
MWPASGIPLPLVTNNKKNQADTDDKKGDCCMCQEGKYMNVCTFQCHGLLVHVVLGSYLLLGTLHGSAQAGPAGSAAAHCPGQQRSATGPALLLSY